MRTREEKPDRTELVTKQHPGHHPQARLVVFYFGPNLFHLLFFR
jgi:hypothetical protein